MNTQLAVERGTWILTIQGQGNPDAWPYNQQRGSYKAIERLVFISAQIEVSSLSESPTGAIMILGIPFSASATTFRYPISLQSAYIPIPANTQLFATVEYHRIYIGAIGSEQIQWINANALITNPTIFTTGYYLID